MKETQDKGYRLLFAIPRMVEDLIRIFVGDNWVKRLDFSTLEKVSERDVSPELVRREKDLLWRLKFRPTKGGKPGENDWFYVYLHLEFQSRPHRFMALRAATYRLLTWEDLMRRGVLTSSGKLPPIISIVLYNGKADWTAPTSLRDLVEPLPGAPDLLSYRLIEEKAYADEDLASQSNPVAGLFRLERSRDMDELYREVSKLASELAGDEHRNLREAFAALVSQALIPTLAPELETPRMMDIAEVPSMLAESVAEWAESWKQEGQREGEVRLLVRQLELKFGALPPWARERVDAANAQRLMEWGERVLTATSLGEVFSS